MTIPKIVGAQRDFSSGEVDEALKRGDELPAMRAGARQMANWRILKSKAVTNRPGRLAQFVAVGRTEEFVLNGGIYFLNFSPGQLTVYNFVGAIQYTTSTMLLTPNSGPVAIPWTANTIAAITWTQAENGTVYIAYADGAPNNVPQLLYFAQGTWTLQPFSEATTPGGQKRAIFDRIAPQGITLTPGATTGTVNVAASEALFAAGMVGTRLRYCGRQMTITAVFSPIAAQAVIAEPLPPGMTLSYASLQGAINIGDEVVGSVTGAAGIVVANARTQVLLFQTNVGYVAPAHIPGQVVTGGTSLTTATLVSSTYSFDGTNFRRYLTVVITAGPGFVAAETVTGPDGAFFVFSVNTVAASGVVVQVIPTANNTIIQFAGTELVVGPSGQFALTGTAVTVPQAVTIWDQEVMNFYWGFPSSVFSDQFRLGFCNFPSRPSGIAWSAIGLRNDFYVGALADNAIFETAPSNTQVLYVVPGMESSEFVFCNDSIHYIPITAADPLQPGSVSFHKISDFGILPSVQPRRAEQTIVFMKPGGAAVAAIQAPGAYYRPYVVDSLSEMHSHLFTASPAVAIAIPGGSLQFEELYIYICLANGSLVVGHYAMKQGLIEAGPEGKPAVGWVPWNGIGVVTYVASGQTDVIFCASYFGVNVVELLSATQYLDASLLVNNLPAAFTPPGGKGPLYKFPGPGSTVFLVDQTTRFEGVYLVDGNGFIIPTFRYGENLSAPSLIAGLGWTATLEPFAPDANPGTSVEQRMRKRRTSRVITYVSNSSGFVFARLFSGPITPTSVPLGTIANSHRIPPWNPGDDPALPPPLREQAYFFRPLGRDYDPRRAVIKDQPGPLLVHEVSFEVTV